LRDLRGVIAVGASVTDKGLTELAKLEQLETLHLIDTQCTDAGLDRLRTLGELVHLRLEGDANGRCFTDAGLRSLSNCGNLQQLVLYGKGFTNSAVEHLRRFPKLEYVAAFDVLMTQVGMNKLKDVTVRLDK
ncbi:MAG: hypothetical protein N2C14_12945, partial [Planctomycetales bacterium]